MDEKPMKNRMMPTRNAANKRYQVRQLVRVSSCGADIGFGSELKNNIKCLFS
jgi:hypothetical protein